MTGRSVSELPDFVLSHMFASPANRPLAHALYEAGKLQKVISSNDFTYKPWLRQLVGEGPWQSRQWELPRGVVDETHWPDALGKLMIKIGLRHPGVGGYETTALAHDWLAARRLGNSAGALYAYEDAALWQFRKAKQQGMVCVYELPAGYYGVVQRRSEALVAAGGESFWREPPWKLRRKDAEMELADLVVANSYYMAEAAAQLLPHKQVLTLPHLMPADEFVPDLAGHSGPLRLLYVGGLSHRKGVPMLLDIWREMAIPAAQAQLHLVGAMLMDRSRLQVPGVQWTPYLSRREVAEAMRQADLLVFPTFCDGYGMVFAEALACGTPVLASQYSGARGLVEDGVQGWIMDPDAPVAFAEVLRAILADPARLRGLRPAARALAESWSFRSRRHWMLRQLTGALCV